MTPKARHWGCGYPNAAGGLLELASDQNLGMLAGNVQQAQRGSGRFPPPALPTRGGHRRDVHHRGKNRLADVQFLAD